MTDSRYALFLSLEEISDTRMALVAHAQSYQEMARNAAFYKQTATMLQAEATAMLAIADRISSVIRRVAIERIRG
jgi:hypothetical protein